MNEQKPPKAQLERLASFGNVVFEDEASLKALLNSLDSTNNRHIRIATEGALLGTIMEHGVVHPDWVFSVTTPANLTSCCMPFAGYMQSVP